MAAAAEAEAEAARAEAAEAVEGFTPCRRFEGARPGKVFKSGPAGVGYYDEPPPPPYLVCRPARPG